MADFGKQRVWTGALALMVGVFVWHQAGQSQSTTTTQSTAPAVPAATAPAGMSKAEADGIIFERQQIMLQLDKDAKTLGQIAAGSLPTTKLAETTRSIAQAAQDSVGAFEQIVPGGRSKPEVWSAHADFQKDMKTFAAKAEAMAKAGETGNLIAVTGLMIEALPCKECHDRYRAPKTS